MNEQKLKRARIRLRGMTCASCEILIERKLKNVEGMVRADVNHAAGRADLYYTRTPLIEELQDALRDTKYTVSYWNDGAEKFQTERNTRRDHFEIGAIFLLVVAVYFIFSSLDIVPKIAIGDSMSYGVVFAIGLVAALSTCIAVAGGLLLAVAAKYNQTHPHLSGFQKFKPNIFFNAGRIASYTLFGGVIGLAGSAFALSPQATGLVTIIASAVMIALGLKLLRLFPAVARFGPRMPKGITHWIHDFSARHQKGAPFILGASTFFLPCGFTQALQLYVLSTGDPATGALTMLFFSLGTLPALVSIGAISSFAKGAVQRYFLKVAGITVVLLGIFNIGNGLTLAGVTPVFGLMKKGAEQSGASVPVVDGRQIVEMTVRGYDYYPNRFTVVQGVPVEWRVDGREAEGCGQVILSPKLGITGFLKRDGITTIRFTPRDAGTFPFNCSMGMMTSGSAFTVIPNAAGAKGTPSSDARPARGEDTCDPAKGCVVQKLAMEVTNERGFYPSFFTVKKGQPVELTVDAKVPLGGCMSVMTVPKYNVAKALALGVNTIRFTPTEAGAVPITCSMGVEMARIAVTN